MSEWTPPMHTLFAAQRAGSFVVEALLHLTGEPYRVVEAPPWEPGRLRDDLARVNPLRQVPTLVLPNGMVMTESAAIVLYLADRHPQAGIVPPADAPERAVFLRWLVYLVGSVYPTFTVADDPTRWVSGKDAQDELVRRTTEYRCGLWGHVEEAARAAPWFLGERFSAIDLYLAVMVTWQPRRAWFAAHTPKLTAIADRCTADRRFTPVVARNGMA